MNAHTIAAKLEAQYLILESLRDLAATFYALDTRPLVVNPDNETFKVTRVGPDPVPPELRRILRRETEAFVTLQCELAAALEREAE